MLGSIDNLLSIFINKLIASIDVGSAVMNITVANSARLAPWWMGNMRLPELSERRLGTHIAYAGLIMLWVRAMTILEINHYDFPQPMTNRD
jgi:Photosystem II protein